MTDSQYVELLASIQADYRLVTESRVIGGKTHEFWRVADPDALLDEATLLASHEQLSCQPYWAQDWDASYGVACELAERDLTGLHVLDLGCGLGITGAVAAASGASVVMGDYAKTALPLARLNSWPWRQRVRVQSIDWSRDDLNERFDLIVGSEILYDRRDVPHLDRFWRRHLRPHGHVLHGDASRPLTVQMLQQLAARGWEQCVSFRDVEDRQVRVRLVQLWPKW